MSTANLKETERTKDKALVEDTAAEIKAKDRRGVHFCVSYGRRKNHFRRWKNICENGLRTKIKAPVLYTDSIPLENTILLSNC
jgi:hypothetical protein